MVGSNETTQQSRTLTSASDMYYDITQTLSLTTSGDGSQDGIVVITNTGNDDAILSLTNLKVTYSGAGRSKRWPRPEQLSQMTALRNSLRSRNSPQSRKGRTRCRIW